MAFGAQAWGSYDLMLQFDSDATLGDHIDRYDPVNRVYLGSFELQNNSDVTVMTASLARRELYARIGATSTVDVYNFDTGDYLRSLSLPGETLHLSADQSSLLSNSTTAIRSVDLDTGSTFTLSMIGATNIGSFEVVSGGGFIVADNGTRTWRRHAANGALLYNVSYFSSEDISSVVNRPVAGAFGSYAGLSATAGRIQTATDSGSSFSAGIVQSSLHSDFHTLTSAHAGGWVTTELVSSPGVLRASRFVTNAFLSNTFSSGFIMSQTTLIGGPTAMVLAPEPGTMIALAAGVAALLRRRQQTRS